MKKQTEDRVRLIKPESKAAEFLEGYGQAVFEAAIQYLENNRHLVEERTRDFSNDVETSPKATAVV